MKICLFLTGFMLLSLIGFTQSVYDNVNFKLLLFEKFKPGKVYLKNEKIVSIDLNYNAEKHQIVFVEDKQYKELTGLETIDSIVIDHISFVPLQEKIFATSTYKGLYILYDYDVMPTTTTTDHTGSHKEDASKVNTSITSASELSVYKKSSNINIIKKYWVKTNNEFVEVRQLKQLAKAYQVDKTVLTKYIIQHHLNLDEEQDVIVLLNYLTKTHKK
ncbi:MAG: hypothetical protein K2Q21_09090 [Chitinophagaceae bacterium]|nr:hypothetical protein [Chitinophagaceae bacterium]